MSRRLERRKKFNLKQTLPYGGYASSMPTDEDGVNGSYVSRMKQLDKDQHYDLFIVQLSTNDAIAAVPMGEACLDFPFSIDYTETKSKAMLNETGFLPCFIKHNE